MALTYERTADPLTIEPTYCGPPESAHGGVAVGRFATLVEDGVAEVTLLGPPPLDTPLATRVEHDAVIVHGPAGDVARVRAHSGPMDVPAFDLVSEEELTAASDQYLQAFGETHTFPTCVGCGPDRRDPDALRQFGADASDGDYVAGFSVPGSGRLPDWLTIAGLDCPSGATVFGQVDEPPAAAVLGTMVVDRRGRAEAGVAYQVRGRLVAAEGRKLTSDVAMLDPDGSAVAVARAVWIIVDPAAFGAADGTAPT